MHLSATVTIYFDSRGLTNDRYSVKWYVYHSGKQKMFSTGLVVSSQDVKFLKHYSGGLRGTVKDNEKRKIWNEVYGVLLKKAEDVILDLGENFTFSKFKSQINQKNSSKANDVNIVTHSFLQVFNNLKHAGRYNYFKLHENAFNSLKRFLVYNKKYGTIDELKFSHISLQFLQDYEFWMKSHGKLNKNGKISGASITTISMYIRILIKLLENSRENNTIKFEYSPTKNNQYTPPKKKNIKKSLSKDEIKKIFLYNPEPLSYKQRAVDLFLFSYLSNGLNFADILQLNNKSIRDDKIYLIRKKTEKTARSGVQELIIYLTPHSRSILNRWGNKDKTPNRSVWNFLSNVDLEDKETVYKAIHTITGTTNRSLKSIAKELDLPSTLSTYHARHSFATMLMRSEVPLAFISQALGHKSIATTQNYLGSFEDDQAKQFLTNLLPDDN